MCFPSANSMTAARARARNASFPSPGSTRSGLPKRAVQVIGTMSQDRAMCDEFTDNFNRPEAQWNRLASPQRMKAWLAERRAAMA